MEDIAIIGAGPAGLMAAQAAAQAGRSVALYDALPQPARKFLRAGIGGLNLTHSEPFDAFLGRFGDRADILAPMLRQFGPDRVRQWAKDLGCETFVGSSGRVFPKDFKAAPLLRSWLRHLAGLGVRFHPRHRWLGWDEQGALRLATPDGEKTTTARAAILALGGASWPKLGSDGAWTGMFSPAVLAPFRPANCGFEVDWSEHFRHRFAGTPVKAVGVAFGERRFKGEFVITAHGVEGSAVYALSAPLRDAIEADGQAILQLDLKPDWNTEKLAAALAKPRGSRSVASHLERQAGIKGVLAGLAREGLSAEDMLKAPALKAVPLELKRPRPMAEAISTAGGLRFDALTPDLMLRDRPGTFVAGEMLDWEAPTGGYLLTACFATGWAAGQAAAGWIS
ncbi:TIGR03862 family flavoprotein [Magnetospirillum sp. 64-120]|uniref:TIGR03862 family flavoprotein n=1 Tax=Magnetospirillum sp. 64-120 TaxID=1895778 RepID=UPI00092B20A8|nr:TIGR03862 family flavoprotein [Magnetospirillum sp. 64-120]OJX79292.1 MAG: NAD(FAD)-utilizing dehydrogenase [Magnetospirillum sp. 64-120]